MDPNKTNIRFASLAAVAVAAALAAPSLGAVVTDDPAGFALRSSKSINLGGETRVEGSVGSAGNVSRGWNAFVDGDIISGTEDGWKTPDIGSFSSGGSRVSLGWAESASLEAGSYGAFTSNSSTTLKLGAGTYSFDSFQLGWAGNVVADTSAGDVYLLVNGALSAGDETRFISEGPGSLYLISKGNSSFGYKADVDGFVYSNGTLSFGTSSSLTGFAYSRGTLTTGFGSNFAFYVPGPGSLALLPIAAAAGFGPSRRRRR